jgi:hypothetical protein
VCERIPFRPIPWLRVGRPQPGHGRPVVPPRGKLLTNPGALFRAKTRRHNDLWLHRIDEDQNGPP